MHFDIPNVTLTLAVMIGLAVGIDYALFILFRYRQVMKTETQTMLKVSDLQWEQQVAQSSSLV